MVSRKQSDLDRLIDKKCYDSIFDAVASYIEDNPDKLEISSNFVEKPDGATLSDLEFIRTCNTSIDENIISFDAIVSCEIEIDETVRRNRETDGVSQWFRIKCIATLGEVLKNFRVTEVEVYSR
jgi:hypothetical protein